MNDDECPLCTDPLDATDKAINFCQCGYKLCLWCWNQLMETAGKENLPGKCPNCRTEYDKEKITMAQLDPDELHKEQQKKKETKKKAAVGLGPRPPRNLGQVRVVQRNLVYAVGMPLNICREEVLADRNHFGAFGRIKKVSVNRSTPVGAAQKGGPSGSAYVTFYRPEDALRCIESVDGAMWEGKVIKACFGTTKYCNAFLKGVPCNNPDCLYLHDIAEARDSFSKADMVANGLATGRSNFYDLVHPTHNREASEQAHAAIGSTAGAAAGPASVAPGPAAAGAAAAAGPLGVAAAAAPGAAGLSGAGGTPVAAAAARQVTQPIAITGARRPSQSNSPWGSLPAADGLPASPALGAPAAAAAGGGVGGSGLTPSNSSGLGAVGQWAAAAAGRPVHAPVNSSVLADMEWPSLGGGPGEGAPDAAAVGGSSRLSAAASSRLQAAEVGPSSRLGAEQGPTAAAVVAGVAVTPAKQQQQQQQPQEPKRTLATLVKPGKAAKAGKQSAEAAAAAAGGKAGTAADAASSSSTASAEQPPAAAAAAADEAAASSSGAAAAAANGKLTKAEAKKVAKQAAKQQQQLEKQQEQERKQLQQQQKKLEQEQKAQAKQQAKEQKALEKQQKQQQEKQQQQQKQQEQKQKQQADKQPEDQQQQQQRLDVPTPEQLPPAAVPAASKPPPPGFGAVAAAKGPPPGFSGARLPPGTHPAAAAGLQPQLIALARAASNTSLNLAAAGGSAGGGAAAAAPPPGFGAAASPAGSAAGPSASPSSAGVNGMHTPGAGGAAAGTGAAAAAASSGPNSHSSGFDVNSFLDSQVPYSSGLPAASPAHTSGLFAGLGMSMMYPSTPNGPSPGGRFDAAAASTAVAAAGVGGGMWPGGQAVGGSSDAVLAGTPPAAALPAMGPGGGVSGSGGFTLSTLKQSRWSFAQKQQQSPPPAQQQQQLGASKLGPDMQQQQQEYLAPPPGFPAGAVPAAAPGNAFGGFGGWGTNTVAQATSFFKHLLPGVNVTVAPGSSPVMGGGAAVGANGPAAGAAAAPNPGAALLQQLQRGQHQQQHQWS